MRLWPTRRLLMVIISVTLITYLVAVNTVFIHILQPVKTSMVSKVVEHENALFIYNAIPLDYAHLYYRAILAKLWESDPQIVLFLDVSIVNFSAPWYVRGYTVEVSNVYVNLRGLPQDVEIVYTYDEGTTIDKHHYVLRVRVYMNDYVLRKCNATMSIHVKLRVVEWNVLGLGRVFEIDLLNESIPITIDIKYVYPYPLYAP